MFIPHALSQCNPESLMKFHHFEHFKLFSLKIFHIKYNSSTPQLLVFSSSLFARMKRKLLERFDLCESTHTLVEWIYVES